mmetsp:Transcript_34182/g.76596  ORF Transcript_34182/g.76596 Transcript_34182/m.76596 type:complete len:99 (+) Transcript_34182:162-458(+)
MRPRPNGQSTLPFRRKGTVGLSVRIWKFLAQTAIAPWLLATNARAALRTSRRTTKSWRATVIVAAAQAPWTGPAECSLDDCPHCGGDVFDGDTTGDSD